MLSRVMTSSSKLCPFRSCNSAWYGFLVCVVLLYWCDFASAEVGSVLSAKSSINGGRGQDASAAAAQLFSNTSFVAAQASTASGFCSGRENDPLCGQPFQPHSAFVRCSFLPIEFLDCEEPEDLNGNFTKREELGYGCVKFGGQRFEHVEKTSVECTVLPGIECYGERKFRRDGFPCIKYRGHYFTTTLLYSILLGFLGMDRFCLGKTGTAVGKLLTLGGVGIWWIVDIVLLIVGILRPEDNSNWVPYA